MIRIREGAFDNIIDTPMLKVYKSTRGLTAIILDRFDLRQHLSYIEALDTDTPVNLYVFSYGKDSRVNEIPEGLRHKYINQPIPDGVLEVYHRIFKEGAK